jgi:glycosyltransferase involved in cell wall biosynthesis
LSFSSRWYEAQGLVVLEAARNEISAITSDSLAVHKLIEDGVTGMLFKDNDFVDMKPILLTYHQFFYL